MDNLVKFESIFFNINYLKKLKRIPQEINTSKTYDSILSDDEVWPVVKLAKNRKEFMERVIEESFLRMKKLKPNLSSLIEELELTRYQEKLRYKNNPWKVDPDDEVIFWNGVKSKLLDLENSEKKEKQETSDQILKDIISRYVY